MDKRIYRNSYGQKLKSYLMIFLAFFLSAFFNESYALVFNIVPNGPLPTLIEPGETLPASYIIQNNTLSQRNNNFIKYLPPNVAIAGGGCGPNFNLAPHGAAGDSCILNLIISGPVSANDPDPHHHLFACFPGGLTCAGTPFPLNVSALVSISITPTNAFIPTGGTQQYKAVGHFSNGRTIDLTRSVIWHSSHPNFATINAFGLAQGIAFGQTSITATFGSITSNTAVLSVTGSLPGSRFLWVTTGSNQVLVCPVNPDNTIAICHNTNVDNQFNNPNGIDFNLDGTIAYVINFAQQGSVSICPVNDHFFGTCRTGTTGNLIFPVGIDLNPNPSIPFVYIGRLFDVVFNNPATTIRVCRVGERGSLGSCFNTGFTVNNQPAFSQPIGTVFTNNGADAFVAMGQNVVQHCFVNQITGALTGCTSATSDPILSGVLSDITINSTGTRVWITQGDMPTALIVTCQVSGTILTNCQPAISTASLPTEFIPNGIDVNVAGTLAYVADQGNNALFLCPINPDGTFSSCLQQVTVNQPQGIFISF